MCRMSEIYPKQLLYICIDKKAFLLNANRPLSDSLCFTVNKFEGVWGGDRYRGVELGPCIGVKAEARALYREQNDGQTDTTENIILVLGRRKVITSLHRGITSCACLSLVCCMCFMITSHSASVGGRGGAEGRWTCSGVTVALYGSLRASTGRSSISYLGCATTPEPSSNRASDLKLSTTKF